jgi:aspartyl-tRNA(Asn)/glutamyl-tRNA(Gln) amidotransferase subunit A
MYHRKDGLFDDALSARMRRYGQSDVGRASFNREIQYPNWGLLDQGVNAGSFAFPINLSQQPAVSTPCGLTAAGLPIGLQFVGARGADAKVLSAARDFERASQ